MNNKSNAKKVAGKSLKEKRADKADKRAKSADHASAMETAVAKKKR
ncbi:hypothetical protein [Ruania halotolerans]|nr:hypothetical protein [Ruania halotolerans]UFU07918.1 hypothetical protein LQF10_07425 [Ruania halotolerans]